MKLHDFANLFTAYKKKMTMEMNVAKLVPVNSSFVVVLKLKAFLLKISTGKFSTA